jgi:leukotriene-A4 hydrolase
MRLARSFPMLCLPALCLLAVAACQRSEPVATPVVAHHAPAPKPAAPEPAMPARTHDESSYAEPEKARITHLALDLAVDFDKKQLSGAALLDFNWTDKLADTLVLDTRDLSITAIEGGDGTGDWKPLTYTLAPRDPVLGSKLTIPMTHAMRQVRITYATSPQASGLQWLQPSMTEGKTLPFMFSQSEAIHARSWIPLQDTPGVRFSYDAHITTPKDVIALMSADNDPEASKRGTERSGDYRFKMVQQVPSYLLAIAVGDLVFKRISDRSGVWAEPAMLPKAAAEFADTEKMITTAEALYGPYRWGRYDLLVLPPSFPFGGMENPTLTFATPTVIVGDKSLVSLVAHELAHSWSGNLVTNASWKDIWLNEGFTTYVQARITEALYGEDVADMERVIDQAELADEIKPGGEIKPADQVLILPPLGARDPDEVLSDIAYTKGAWFLQFLEQRFGRDVFDAFLKGYFDHFALHSISSDDFEAYLRANLLPKKPGAVTDAELDAWLRQPGIPAVAKPAHSTRFDAVDAARKAWLDSGALPVLDATRKWSTQEWVRFLEGLTETLDAGKIATLDKAYHFSGTPNGEIAQRWYPLAVRSGYTAARPGMAAFLQRIGRRKLIIPTYEALVKTQEGLAFAKDVFAKAKPGYHPITIATVEDLLTKAKPDH